MSVLINTNTSALFAANQLAYSNSELQKTLSQLSSGTKIVTSSDDAGGAGVALKLSATATRDGALLSNVSNATSYAQTQDGSLQVADAVLNRISELKTLYADPTKNASDQANYNSEFSQLQQELNSIAGQTFNGISLFGTGSLDVATTADLASSSDVAVAQQNFLGTSSVTDGFSDPSNWTLSGPATIANDHLSIGGGDNPCAATTTQSFAGAMEIDMNISVPGSFDTFSVSQGGQTLVSLVAGSDINRNQTYALKITLDANGTANAYLNGSSSPVQTQSGLSTAAGAISITDNGEGAATVSNFSATGAGGTNSVSTVASAANLGGLALSDVTSAIQEVATMRANNGGEQSRLNFASALLTTNQTNLQSAVSNITDVDVAAATTALARYNVLVQAGTSMLTQANQAAQTALKLITG